MFSILNSLQITIYHNLSHAPAMYGDDVIMFGLDAMMFLSLSDLVDTITHEHRINLLIAVLRAGQRCIDN